jgi:hypothetical protein
VTAGAVIYVMIPEIYTALPPGFETVADMFSVMARCTQRLMVLCRVVRRVPVLVMNQHGRYLSAYGETPLAQGVAA